MASMAIVHLVQLIAGGDHLLDSGIAVSIRLARKSMALEPVAGLAGKDGA